MLRKNVRDALKALALAAEKAGYPVNILWHAGKCYLTCVYAPQDDQPLRHYVSDDFDFGVPSLGDVQAFLRDVSYGREPCTWDQEVERRRALWSVQPRLRRSLHQLDRQPVVFPTSLNSLLGAADWYAQPEPSGGRPCRWG